MYGLIDQFFFLLILKSGLSGVFFYLYVTCHFTFVLFCFFTFNAKPEGIEKEQTYNTLLCPQGKCDKTKFSG